jgi:hypothetical protein
VRKVDPPAPVPHAAATAVAQGATA